MTIQDVFSNSIPCFTDVDVIIDVQSGTREMVTFKVKAHQDALNAVPGYISLIMESEGARMYFLFNSYPLAVSPEFHACLDVVAAYSILCREIGRIHELGEDVSKFLEPCPLAE